MSADNYRECPKCYEENTREDYEIYSEDDEVIINYSIHCKHCGYNHKINETRKLVIRVNKDL